MTASAAVDPVPGRPILLVGMMGVGKTTVGRLLAARLGRRYVDSDEEVEAATGRTVRELFEEGGEQAFRPLESQALAAAVRDGRPLVVGVAGGAVLDPANRALIQRTGTVVWLRATPETLARRIARPSGTAGAPGTTDGPAEGTADASGHRTDHRPLLEHDPEGVLRRLATERRGLYEAVADAVVDVDDVGPAAAVDRVLVAISESKNGGPGNGGPGNGGPGDGSLR